MQLVKWDEIERQIDAVRDLSEIGLMHDQLEAIRIMARQIDGSIAALNKASKYKFLLEQQTGRLYAQLPASQGERTDITSSHDVTRFTDKQSAAEEVGRDRMTLSRWMRSAEVPRETVEEFEAECNEQGKEFTSAGILRYAREKREPAETPPLPSEKYRVLYADPPWNYGNEQHITRGEVQNTILTSHYHPMLIEELCALPIRDICKTDAVLFLWVPSPQLEVSFRLIHAWGFDYKTSMVWDKVKHNVGNYVSVRHEFLLICTRGSCTPDMKKLVDSVYCEERTDHSRKPEYFRQVIDTLYPNGNAIELFRRGGRVGRWDVWGEETD